MPITASTQQFIPIKQIKQNIVILKNGGLRVILKITPVNFALKNRQEQEMLVGQFQNFLNSLEFPIQLLVQSRRLDIFPYLKSLADYAQNIHSDLLRFQAFDYINFIQKLTQLANIMEKNFFCVVPYEPKPSEQPGILKRLISNRSSISISARQFKTYQEKITERAAVVSNELAGLGLGVKMLSTQEIIEEFYYIFNPEESHEERLEEISKIIAPVIQTNFSPPRSVTQSSLSKQTNPNQKNTAPENLLQQPVDNRMHKFNPPLPSAAPKPSSPQTAPSPAQTIPTPSHQTARQPNFNQSITPRTEQPNSQKANLPTLKKQTDKTSSSHQTIPPSQAPPPSPPKNMPTTTDQSSQKPNKLPKQIIQDAQKILKNLS